MLRLLIGFAPENAACLISVTLVATNASPNVPLAQFGGPGLPDIISCRGDHPLVVAALTQLWGRLT